MKLQERKTFHERLYEEIDGFFPVGDIEVYLTQPGNFADSAENYDYTVRLVHVPTGAEMECSEFPSQAENYVIALVKLKIAHELLVPAPAPTAELRPRMPKAKPARIGPEVRRASVPTW